MLEHGEDFKTVERRFNQARDDLREGKWKSRTRRAALVFIIG